MLERYTKEASTIQQQVEMRENPNRRIKIKLISSMFPEKIEFDGKTYRTNSYNKVLDLIYQQTNKLRGGGRKEKRREFFNFLRLSTQTRGRTGMEVNPLVFETSASTDSAIWACLISQLRCKDTAFF